MKNINFLKIMILIFYSFYSRVLTGEKKYIIIYQNYSNYDFDLITENI